MDDFIAGMIAGIIPCFIGALITRYFERKQDRKK